MKCDIGECVYVLYHKLWGRTIVGNRIRSKAWWEKRLQDLINTPTITIEHKYEEEWTYDIPPRYEDEYQMSNSWEEYFEKWDGWLKEHPAFYEKIKRFDPRLKKL